MPRLENVRRRVEMAKAGINLREDGAHEAGRQLLLELLHEDWEGWMVDAMLYGLGIYGRVELMKANEQAAMN